MTCFKSGRTTTTPVYEGSVRKHHASLTVRLNGGLFCLPFTGTLRVRQTREPMTGSSDYVRSFIYLFIKYGVISEEFKQMTYSFKARGRRSFSEKEERKERLLLQEDKSRFSTTRGSCTLPAAKRNRRTKYGTRRRGGRFHLCLLQDEEREKRRSHLNYYLIQLLPSSLGTYDEDFFWEELLKRALPRRGLHHHHAPLCLLLL